MAQNSLPWVEGVEESAVKIAVTNMKNAGVKIIALIVANAEAARDVLAEASLQGLAGPDYVFLGGDATMDVQVVQPPEEDSAKRTDEFMARVIEAAQGAIGVLPYLKRSGPAYEDFMELWRSTPNITNTELAYEEPGGSLQSEDNPNIACGSQCMKEPEWGAAYAYDAVRLMGRAWVNATASGSDPRDLPSGSLLEALRSVSLSPEESVLGGLKLNPDTGDPVGGSYDLLQFQPVNAAEGGKRRLAQDAGPAEFVLQPVGIVKLSDTGVWSVSNSSEPLDFGEGSTASWADPPKDGGQLGPDDSFLVARTNVETVPSARGVKFSGDAGGTLTFEVVLGNSFGEKTATVGKPEGLNVLPATVERCGAGKVQIGKGGVPRSRAFIAAPVRGICEVTMDTKGIAPGKSYCLDFQVNGERRMAGRDCFYSLDLRDPTYSPLDTLIWALPTALGAAAVLATILGILLWRRRVHNMNKDWIIDESELKMADPPVVLGVGGQGDVVEATFRGTPVAVKRYFNFSSPRGFARIPSISETEATGSGSSLLKSPSMEKSRAAQPQPEVAVPPKVEDTTAVETSNAEDAEDPKSPPKRMVSFPPGIGGSSSELTLSNDLGRAADPSPSSQASPATSGTASQRSGQWDLKGSANISSRSQLKSSSKSADRSRMREEMRIIARLRHPNIVQTLGAVMKGSSMMVVMERMNKGSMHSMLVSEATADLELYLQILLDAVHGLRYLHEAKPPYIHGDMKSLNILVDENLKGKLADFGLSFLKSSSLFSSGVAGGSPLWMAPELFKKGASPSESTDIYALGVTMMEMWARRTPYWELVEVAQTPLEEVLRRIREEELRPSDPSRSCPRCEYFWEDRSADQSKELLQLARECMLSNPKRRPDLVEIESRLQAVVEKLAPGKRSSGGRNTQQSRLLHDILPPKVARALLEGRKVEPETFDPVTIFFSDVVNFTKLSGKLPPEMVMSFLDRMYSSFDALARKHGLFKVETIGDAYMCVGGLPEPQSDHTLRVARFAVEAMKAAAAVAVDPNDPSKGTLQIRVGFHTGSVVASVVGSTNPRYCLFGDTVNTASRMESNSQAGRINCSPESQVALAAQIKEQGFRGLRLTSRGRTEVKGKGKMEMFFVDQVAVKDENGDGSPSEDIAECSSHRPAVDWDDDHSACSSDAAAPPRDPFSFYSERGGGKYG